MRRAAIIALAAAGCTTSVAPAKAVLSASAPPPLPKHAVAVKGVSTYTTQLFFTQPGRVLMTSERSIALVDTQQFRQIGEARSFASETVKDDRDPNNHEISREVYQSAWAWDRDQVRGVVLVGGFGGADPRGLAVWRPASEPTPTFVSSVHGYGYNCRPVAFSPDLARFATISCEEIGGPGTALRVFATDRGTPLAQVDNAVRATFSPDGKQVAFSTSTNDIGLLDVASGRVTMLPHAHGALVLSLAFHPTRSLLVTADGDFAAYAWDLSRGTHEKLAELGSHVAFSPDARYLALAQRGDLVLVDPATWHRTAELHVTFSWGPDALAWSQDSSQLAVAISGDNLEVFQVGRSEPRTIDDAWWDRFHRLPPPTPTTPPAIAYNGVVSGTVLVAGKPLAGAEVRLTPDPLEWPDARALTALTVKTRKDGTFRLQNVPQITWSARVTATGMQLGGFAADLRKAPTVDAAVTLEPAVTIAGRVTGPDGRPAGVVRIVNYMYDGTITLDQPSQSDGSFTIDHMRPGSLPYEIGIRRADGAVRFIKLDVTKARRVSAPVTLFAATDPHVVRVHVIDKAKKPVEAATVILNESRSFPTDANGDASFDVVDMKWVPVRVMSTHGYSSQERVDLPQTRPPLEIQLTP